MKTTVTAQHIKDGWLANCNKCPVALALQSAGFPLAQVSGDGIYLNGRGERIKTPALAREFIKTFDHLGGMAVRPFEFELDCGS